MDLINGRNYYVATTDAVLREKAAANSAPVNHLLFGDWMRYTGETRNHWASVRCRGCDGWLPISAIREDRILEVNFVDIGQGDGCHIAISSPPQIPYFINSYEGNSHSGVYLGLMMFAALPPAAMASLACGLASIPVITMPSP